MSEPIAAHPILTATDYSGMVEAMRALKAHLELSNGTVDALCGWTNGHCDKLLGPTSVRAFSPKTFNDMLWVLAARITITLDLDRLQEMAEHYEKRCPAHTREKPNRISKKVIESAKPAILSGLSKLGNDARNALLPGEQRIRIARKAARKSRRLKALPPEQRRQIAQHAARARWSRRADQNRESATIVSSVVTGPKRSKLP